MFYAFKLKKKNHSIGPGNEANTKWIICKYIRYSNCNFNEFLEYDHIIQEEEDFFMVHLYHSYSEKNTIEIYA